MLLKILGVGGGGSIDIVTGVANSNCDDDGIVSLVLLLLLLLVVVVVLLMMILLVLLGGLVAMWVVGVEVYIREGGSLVLDS